MALMGEAAAQPPTTAPLSPREPETIYTEASRDKDRSIAGETVRAVIDPVYGVDDQFARWKRPICFNVYGLTPIAKYNVESRMKEVAQEVSAPVDHSDPCQPNVTIVFTPDRKATLDSIYKVRPELLQDYGFIRNRLKESLPVQAWYGVSMQVAGGRSQFVYGDEGDGLSQGPPIIRMSERSRLNTGISTALESVVIVADTKAVTGKSLESIADYFAVLALGQIRETRQCKHVPTIVNLMFDDCDAGFRADSATKYDIAMLTGLYEVADDKLQTLQRQRIVGAARRAAERLSQ